MLGPGYSRRREPSKKATASHVDSGVPDASGAESEKSPQVAEKSAEPVQETEATSTGNVVPVWKLSQKDEEEYIG